jgi:hypothetical protein
MKVKILHDCIYVRNQEELNSGQAWWCTAIITAFERMRQENHEFQAAKAT